MKIAELFPADREQRINGTKHVVAEDGTWVVVAPWHNHLHLRALARVKRLRLTDAEEEKRDLETEDRLECRAMAQGVLRGWGGPDTEPYSVEAAEEALYTQLAFRDKVVALALQEQRRAFEEETTSGKGSPTGSSPPRRGRKRRRANGDGSGVSSDVESTSPTV